MADNIALNAGDSGGAIVKTDDDGTAHWQYVKIAFGADNTQTRVTSLVGLPVKILTGTAEIGKLAAGVAEIGNVKNSGVFAVQEDGDALTALQLIDNIVLSEDAAHGSGDAGVMALAVRNDALEALAGSDGDYAPLQVDAEGALYTHVPNEISSGNSTTSTLTSGSTFTGTGEDVSQHSQVSIIIDASHDSATNGMLFEFSIDNSNWDKSFVFTYTASNEARVFQLPIHAQYFRFRYTNGGSDQTHFRVQTIYLHTAPVQTTHRLVDDVDPDRSVSVVKAVIIAQAAGTGDFMPVQATAGGNLKTSLEEVNGGLLGGGTEAAAMRVTMANNSTGLLSVDNDGIFVVQEDGDALTALQLIDDPVFADDAPFTLASSKVAVAGAIRDDQTGTLAAAEGDVVPLRVDAEGHLHTHSHLFDPGTIDSFGHLLTASAANQIDIQFFRDTPANLLTVTTAGGGATSQVGGAGKFETSTAGTANAKGVTTQKTSYRSGAEIFTIFTETFTTPTDANSFQRHGLYDDNDGMFIGFEGTSFGVTIRNGASDTTVAKGSFSEDTLTGAVGSKFTRAGVPEAINLTKFNIYRIRYGWLGSAPIEFEVLSPDGHWVTFHQIKQPNLATVASIENPDLPMTIHVSKTGADATNLIMTSNCWGAGVTERALPLNETLTDATLAQISRVVIVGKTAGGTYVNVQTTNSGNLKLALDEYDGVPTGAGTASGALRVELPTDGTGKVGLNAGSALVGDVGLSGARTSGGTTPYKNIDVDTKDEVKATAGQVYWISAMNTTDAPVFLKFYDLAAASVTVGTTVPDLTFLVPANADSDGAGFKLAVPNGIEFGTGITIAGTLLVADNDNTALGANALIVNLGFA